MRVPMAAPCSIVSNMALNMRIRPNEYCVSMIFMHQWQKRMESCTNAKQKVKSAAKSASRDRQDTCLILGLIPKIKKPVIFIMITEMNVSTMT